MGTVRDLINRSFRLNGVLASGETLGATEQNDAFNTLNDLIADWSNQNLFIPTTLREAFPLVPGQATYQMGTGAPDFNSIRPQKIEHALIEIQTNPEAELPIKIVTEEEYQGIIIKSVQSSLPLYLYPDFSYPYLNISLWPVPSVVENLILYSWKPLAAFVTVNDTVTLPQGYQRALIYSLAIELAPEYGKEPTPIVVALANEAKEVLKRLNIRTHLMQTDDALLSGKKVFNWLTGE